MTDAERLLANIFSLGDWPTWQVCLDHAGDGLKSLHNASQLANIRRVILTGCGSSYYAGQVGRYLIERIARLPAEARQAFAFTHYTETGLLAPDTLVVGLSTTGHTASTCTALALARERGARTLAITAAPGSRITAAAEATVTTGGRVSVIVQTETYVQSLVALYLLALELAGAQNRLAEGAADYWLGQLRAARELTHALLDTQAQTIQSLAEASQATQAVFILGSGPNAGTAEEAALKVIEMAKLSADGGEMEDFFHGRDRELSRDTRQFFLAPQGPALARTYDFLTFTRRAGLSSDVVACQADPHLDRLADRILLFGGALDEYATPLIYVTPLYLFSYHLALRRGFDPVTRRYGMPALQVFYRGSPFDPDADIS